MSFFPSAISLWNDLPEETVQAKTLQSFRSPVDGWLWGNQAHWTPRSLLSLVDYLWFWLLFLHSAPHPPSTTHQRHPSPLPLVSLGSESRYMALRVSDSSPAWQGKGMLKLYRYSFTSKLSLLFLFSDYACLSTSLYNLDVHHQLRIFARIRHSFSTWKRK